MSYHISSAARKKGVTIIYDDNTIHNSSTYSLLAGKPLLTIPKPEHI